MHLKHLRAAVAFAAAFFLASGAPERAAAQAGGRQYGTANIQAGYRLYAAQCALCHGNNGDGIAGVNLPRQQFKRASSDADIRNTVTGGVLAAGMPSFPFQPSELDSLVAYIRSGFDLAGAPFTVGDSGRGKAIYDGKGGCAACHRVKGNGSLRAPDLSDIGVTRKPSGVQRSILEPSAGMLPINRPVRIVTREGRTILGRRLNEDTASVQLIDREEKLISLLKTDIREFEIGTQSQMPSFAGRLSESEIADLLAYLLSLKG